MTVELTRADRALTETLSAAARSYRKALADDIAVAEMAGRGRNERELGFALSTWALADLRIPKRNVRKRDQKHISEVMRSIRDLGFVAPIIVTPEGEIIDGVVTYLAATELGMAKILCVAVHGLNKEQVRLVRLALNRLSEKGGWDLAELKVEFEELSAGGAPIEVTGFTLPEVDQIVLSAKPGLDAKANCPAPIEAGPAVSRLGDLWLLGEHRVLCGDATKAESYGRLFQAEQAQMLFSDPPYNIEIQGFAVGAGSIKHREFVAASGEMTDEQFVEFLTNYLSASATALAEGGIGYLCMDWRHTCHVHAALENTGLSLLNLICWSKGNGGLGGLYRSAHELVFVFKKGSAPHVNNVELGKHGRDRTNVWTYPGANRIGSSANRELANHPTPKPVELVADAILDVSTRGQIVLDPFLGSGTTIVAAEKTGRTAYGLELDPLYVDSIVRRYEKFTGKRVVLEGTSLTFGEIQQRRAREQDPPDGDSKPHAGSDVAVSAGTVTA